MVILNVWLRISVLYDDEETEMATKGDNQLVTYYIWCYIEVAFFTTTFVSASIFTLFRACFKMPIQIQALVTKSDNINVDFLEVESLFLDLLNMITAPVLINL